MPLSKIPFQVNDVRIYNPKAVAVANHLGSQKPSDYILIADWMVSTGQSDYSVDTLVELFDREVGLPDDELSLQSTPIPA